MTGASSLGPFAFGPFRIDVDSHRVWRGDREIHLRPKAWDVLRHLIERPGLLITKDVFHREIWRDTAVSDDALTKSIAELRRALGDTARTPRFIETVHGLGFRFVADVRDVGATREAAPAGADASPLTESRRIENGALFVGRHAELQHLHECLRRARGGERQLVFITGEAGIGKTTLSGKFLSSVAVEDPDLYVLHGQCIQQHGQREPYMPVLEALERVLSSPAGAPLIPQFRRMAPGWFVQVPWLLSEGEPPVLHGAMMSAPPERMLREIGAFLESMAARSTVVLLLEDLHWSDSATASLLSFLAERRDLARLLIIGTYRPVEASTQDHPIREVHRTLRAHRRCIDLALDYLSVSDVREYLRGRFGADVENLGPLIHGRTDGNPLFVVAIVEELIRRGQLVPSEGGWVLESAIERVELALPQDLIEMVTAQFQRVSAEERSFLEAAAVAGVSFAPGIVGQALGEDAEEVEAVSQRMARSGLFLNVAGRSEDSGSARRYDFFHALHRQVIYEQIPDRRRRRLHLALGEALELTSAERVAEIASELSFHFERGGDHARAVAYLGSCVARAQRRFAHHEAVTYGRHAIGLLDQSPETPGSRQQELELRLLLGVSLNVTRGYFSAEVRENYERARALCEDVGHARQLFAIIHAVWYAQVGGTEADGARRSVDDLERLAESLNSVELRIRASLARGLTDSWSGNFGTAVQILTQFLEELENDTVGLRSGAYGVDVAVGACMQGGLALWFVGCPDQARVRAARGLSYAEKSGQPFDRASALFKSAFLRLLCGDATAAGDLAARAASVCADNDIPFFFPYCRFLRGASLAEQGDVADGLAEMLQSLADQRAASGSFFCDVILAHVAAACGRAGRWDEGLRYVDEGIALTETRLERLYAAEVWRIKGELLLGKAEAAQGRRRAAARPVVDAARECFRRALEIAGTQEARSLALRSAMSLARLSRRYDRADQGRELLDSVYTSFTEGFDTKDLQDAKALLRELAAR